MTASRSTKVILLAACLWLSGFCFVSAEQITDFSVVVELESTGSFIVTETITYDFGSEERRGIYRNVKNQHTQPASQWYRDRYIDIALLTVLRNGQFELYQEEAYDGLSVRIGDPDIFLTGEHTYEISYRVDGAIAQFPDTQEFYWNVTGAEWSVPIESSSLLLLVPPGVLRAANDCYVGFSGATTACSEIELVNENTVRFRTDRLEPGEQLTVAQAVALPVPPQILEKTNQALLVLLGLVGWLGLLFLYTYLWRTKYKKSKVLVTQYEPLPDFLPMFTGVLIDGRLDARDISAGLVYLAQQGFIRVKEIKRPVLRFFTDTDYEVTLLKPITEATTEFHKSILELLFNDMRFKSQTDAREYRDFIGSTVSLDELKTNQAKLRGNLKKIHKLKKAIKQDLIERGFLERRLPITLGESLRLHQARWVLFGFLVMVLILVWSLALFTFIVLTMVFLVTFAAERRTIKGYQAQAHLKGFKKFLAMTEKERYAFHNAPSKNPDQFMEYLPYAIAFGVEKEWAKVFADIQIIQPDWYQGANSTGAFNAGVFSDSVSTFSSSFSNSSGSSGSSGGGSAGGGSGGGGGGSW